MPKPTRTSAGERVDLVALLRAARTVLLIDWPSREVPEVLARSGLDVDADEGPRRGYTVYEADGDEVRTTPASRAPEHTDIVFVHRPVDELPDIAERARTLGARAIWYQSGMDAASLPDVRGCWMPADDERQARQIVESAGLVFVSEPYIAEVARQPQRE